MNLATKIADPVAAASDETVQDAVDAETVTKPVVPTATTEMAVRSKPVPSETTAAPPKEMVVPERDQGNTEIATGYTAATI